MKKIIKHFIPFFTAVVIFCFSACPLSVSALSPFPIPDKRIIVGSRITNDIINTFVDTLSENETFVSSGLDKSKCFAFMHFDYNDNLVAEVLDDTGTFKYVASSNLTYSCYYTQPFISCSLNKVTGFCDSCHLNSNTGFYVTTLCYIDDRYTNGELRDYGSGGFQYGSDNSGNGYSDYAIFPLVAPFNPIVNPLYRYNYSLNVNVEKFSQWLIETGKYKDIVEELAENRVTGLVSIFAKNGGNNNSFADSLKQYFKYISIAQYVDDYGTVVNKIRLLYHEFQKQEKDKLMDIFFHRTEKTDNIKPVTNDDDLTLITNSDDDTVIVKILRDILRSLIALPNNISNLINSLSVQVDGLENTVNVVNQSGLPDLSSLWTYNNNDFDDDLNNFSSDIAEVQQLPVSYLTNINENSLMPEKMLNDKDNLTVNIPNMSGFTVSDDGKSFSTQTTSYVITSNDYPWLDPLVKKIKRFSGILLILGYLVSLRYRLPEIVRGE